MKHLPESTPIMKRPMMSISKDFAVSPKDSSRAAITAKLLFISKVPFLQSGTEDDWKKKDSLSKELQLYWHRLKSSYTNVLKKQ